MLLINFVCNSKIARKVTRTHNTHTHTQLSPPLHTHNTHPNIYALTNVEIMQVNRLIGSSNGHTLRPEEKEEQKEESLPRKYTLNMCVCVVSKYVYTGLYVRIYTCVCVDKLQH